MDGPSIIMCSNMSKRVNSNVVAIENSQWLSCQLRVSEFLRVIIYQLPVIINM